MQRVEPSSLFPGFPGYLELELELSLEMRLDAL